MEGSERINKGEEQDLRRALAQIAQASADQARERSATPAETPNRSRRQHRRLILAVAAAGAMMVAGASVWMVVGGGGAIPEPVTAAGTTEHTTPGSAAGERGQSLAEWIACSQTIAIGEVTDIMHPRSGRVRISLRVSNWIRPSTGPERIIVSDIDPKRAGLRPQWRRGGPVLVVVPANRTRPVAAFRGTDLARYRSWIESALPAAASATCPPAFAGDTK